MPQSWRDAALVAYQAADYGLCVELLKGRRGADHDLLLAKAYLRLRSNAEAEGALKDSAARGRPIWFSLMAAARGRQGDLEGAHSLIDEALSSAKTPDETAYALYQRALLYWLERRVDEAESILSSTDFAGSLHHAEELRAWIASERGDYVGAMRAFARAAALAREDLAVEVTGLTNAALHAREMYEPAVMEAVLRRAAEIQWTPHLSEHRFQITRYAAWLNAIEGDFRQAMRRMYEAASLEISPAWRTYALCDRAYLSLVLGEEVNGWAAASEALAWAESVAWESCQSGEHAVLLYLAGLVAARHPREARRCRERYEGVKPSDALRSTWVREPHMHALEEFTDGLLAAAAHDNTAAAANFHRAFSTYQRIGYRWRAVLTLLALRDVGVSRPGYDEYVEATLQRFPNSWLRDLAERELRKSLPLVAAA
jgi:hypothetical protein